MAEKLLLVRHGKTDDSYDGRFIGSTDVPLGAIGRRQAEALGRVLCPAPAGPMAGTASGHYEISAGYRSLCSPMKRAIETAEAAGLEFEIEPELREVDFGRWEGMTFDQIGATDPEGVACWANDYRNLEFPGGESIKAFLGRIERVAARISADPARTVLCVTHGGVIRALICHFLGLDPEHYLLFDVKPASITTISPFDGRGVLMGLNDTCHL